MTISTKSIKTLAEVLQLPAYCTSTTIKLEPNNLITLEVTSILDDETVEDLCEVIKRFKLVEVEDESCNRC